MVTKPDIPEKANTQDGLPTDRQDCISVPLWAKFLRNLLWLPLVIVIAIFILEGIFSLAHIGEEQIWKPDPSFGFIGYANKRFTFRSEGYSEEVSNSGGFNDREFSLIKPPGVVRIAILGDSKTEALQVPRQSNFCKVLESQLNSSRSNHFEVMNFGVSAFSTGQEYLLYLDRVVAYAPDIVIVMYNPSDNEENHEPFFVKASDVFPRPYFLVSADGKLKIDWSIVDEHMQDLKVKLFKKLETMSIHSRVLLVLEKAESNLEETKLISWFKQLSEIILRPLKAKPALLFSDYKSRPKWLSEFNSTYGQETVICPLTFDLPNTRGDLHTLYLNSDMNFYVTANILSRLQHSCSHDHCKLVVACLPSINNDMRYLRELNHMSKLAKLEGFLFIDIHHSFPPLAPMQTSDLMFPSLHLTAKGHKIIADTLYRELVNSNVVQVSLSTYHGLSSRP